MRIRVISLAVMSAWLFAGRATGQSSQPANPPRDAAQPDPPVAARAQKPAPSPAAATTAAPTDPGEQIVVPAGTHLPLLLRNGVNTRTAKAGDVVYFETMYPISVANRVVIPMGSFVRGQVVSAKRPGRIAGRGEFRVALEQMTFLNGYTIELRATPSSVDRDGREAVDSEGKIKGPSSVGRDVGLVAVGTGGGAYIGALAGAINGTPGRGALIGGGIGGIGTLLAILATRGPEAELSRGTTMDVVFDRPLILNSSYLPANTAGVDPQRTLPPPGDSRRRMSEALRQRMIQRSLHLPFPLT